MRRFIYSAAVALGLFGWTAVQAEPDDPPAAAPQNAAATKTPSQQRSAEQPKVGWPINNAELVKLRKEYPVESLRNRLQGAAAQSAGGRGEPILNPEAKSHLNYVESQVDRRATANRRTQVLKELHLVETEKFVSRPGAGVSRMRNPAHLIQTQLQLPKSDTAALPILPGQLSDQFFGRPLKMHTRPDALARSQPTESGLAELHAQSQVNFVQPAAWGFVKDLDHVVGFESHGFRTVSRKAVGSDSSQRDAWEIHRLELVSLLLHPEPVLYVSADLPEMKALAQTKTRKPTAFEASALERLAKGEELLIDEPAPDRVVMVGALRATKQCLQCHDAARGAMLGAFSYELLRTHEAAE